MTDGFESLEAEGVYVAEYACANDPKLVAILTIPGLVAF